MICYVATYPRSGSAMLRDLLVQNFVFLVVDIYTRKPLEMKPEYCLTDVDEYTQTYVIPGTSERRFVLKSPIRPILKARNRQRLAARPERYFVKTHEYPFESYYPGESAIQMIRHPGAAITSLFILQKALFDSPKKFEEYIAGKDMGGNWSEYHERWRAAVLPKMVASYEDAFYDQRPLVERMATFLKEPLIGGEARTVSLDAARARNPIRSPGAGIDGWRTSVTPDQLELLREYHGAAARQLGYAL